MSKSKASKMRGYAAKLGSKVPYKVQYDSKKMLTGTAIPSEQMDNNLQTNHNRMIRRMQAECFLAPTKEDVKKNGRSMASCN